MGQQQSQTGGTRQKKTTGQTSSLQQLKHYLKSNTAQKSYQHENILKISRIPFENSNKMQIDNQVVFVENTKISLQELVKCKRETGRVFLEEEVRKIIENVVYALAYLEDMNVLYQQLTMQNIYLTSRSRQPTQSTQSSTYKILPPLNQSNIYQSLRQCLKQKSHQYVPASPQMIIALRCHQQQFQQKQMVLKSNIFIFGMILLEVCTLKSSAQCYDLDNYDILDDVIMARIEEIQRVYSKKVVMIVANMLDYDFEERMTPKELSIWINREFNQLDNQQQDEQDHINRQGHNKQTVKQIQLKKTPNFHKSRLEHSQINTQSQLVYQGNGQADLQPYPYRYPLPKEKQRSQQQPQQKKIVNSRLYEQAINKRKDIKNLKIKINDEDEMSEQVIDQRKGRDGQNNHQNNYRNNAKIVIKNEQMPFKEKQVEKRIDIIRNKILKEKMKAQMDFSEIKQSTKSKNKRNIFNNNSRIDNQVNRSTQISHTYINKNINIKKTSNDRQKSKSKNLPNPYLNHTYIPKTPQKQHLVQGQPAYKHHNNSNSNSASKFKYQYNLQSDGQADCSNFQVSQPQYTVKNINLKYKYNVGEDNPQMNSNRKRDGERFVRIEKEIGNYQRSISSKRQNRLFDENNQYKAHLEFSKNTRDTQMVNKEVPVKQLVKSSSIKNLVSSKIADYQQFDPNLDKKQKQQKKHNINQSEPQQLRKNLLTKSNIENIQQQKYQRQLKPGSHYKAQAYIQRHQQYFQQASNPSPYPPAHHQNPYLITHAQLIQNRSNQIQSQDQILSHLQSKRNKKSIKQNEDILFIKKQIERSRKLIEEVKRTEKQNQFF